jgi:hypothetical protein
MQLVSLVMLKEYRLKTPINLMVVLLEILLKQALMEIEIMAEAEAAAEVAHLSPQKK